MMDLIKGEFLLYVKVRTIIWDILQQFKMKNDQRKSEITKGGIRRVDLSHSKTTKSDILKDNSRF